ncbi:ATP-binding protein [Pseudomonas sp. Marseille-Q5115]|uniref:hybrid sensor histidine kinase/response regulator n=1 Tax=Pseudomonas sp. Marseille-Q5115 TaxID=2866593 RepID=UPI001CE45531|nr:ATP-binding protein [Pseudomonas sp. Marseille-Q5115]
MRHPLSSLRGGLLTLVLASTVPLALCAAVALFMLLRNEEGQAIARALEANRQTATAVQVTLNRSFAVLAAVAASPLLDSDDLGPYNQVLARVLPLMPGWHSMLVTTPEGQVLSRVSPRPATGFNSPVEPASFKRMIEHPGPIVGQLGQGPSGTWAIPLRVPVMRNGALRYVLTAPLLPQNIAEVLALSQLPKGWTVVVFDSNGRRIARVPEAGFAVGDQVSPELGALVASDRNEGAGVSHTSNGDEVYTAWLRLPDAGWTVATGIPTKEVNSKVTKALLLYGGGLGLSLLFATVAALLAARRISQPMAGLRKAARAVGRGEIPQVPSTPIKEINDVSVALEASAVALRDSERARDEAVARLETAHQGLLAADRRKDEFIATLAHELRNPLVPVGQAAALLRSASASPAQRSHSLAVIDRQVGNMGRLLDDLLDASRVSFGNIPLRLEPLELNAVLHDALAFINSRARDKQLQVRASFSSDPLPVEGDALRLQQLFVNLLDNAVKYTPAGGQVRISLCRLGGQACVEVADSGIGIAPENLAQVFRMFGRVAGPGVDAGGLGVGLALAKNLVDLHGGELNAASDGLGQGSCFTVTLPLANPTVSAVAAAPSPVAPVSPGRRVLVADDNQDIAFTLQALLEMESHEVRMAADGQQALDLCRDSMPHVAVLDIGMPRLDGYQAAAAIRALPGGEGVYLIAVSGWGQAEDVRLAEAAGFDRHLTKPADLDLLLELVASARR